MPEPDARVATRAHTFEILVCSGPTCAGKRGADHVYRALCQRMLEHGLQDRVRAGRKKCFGFCLRGPNVYVRALVAPGQPARRSALYNGVAVADVSDILGSHVLENRVLQRLIQAPAAPDNPRSDGDHGRADIRLARAPVAEPDDCLPADSPPDSLTDDSLTDDALTDDALADDPLTDD